MQTHRSKSLNASNWAVRVVANIKWAVLVELPSLVFKTDDMLGWDQAIVAATIGPLHTSDATRNCSSAVGAETAFSFGGGEQHAALVVSAASA